MIKLKLVKRVTAPDDTFALRTWGKEYWLADLTWGSNQGRRIDGVVGFGRTRREALYQMLGTVFRILWYGAPQ